MMPSIPDHLRPYLDTIAARLLSGHAAVMVGAGFSKNAAPPGSAAGFPDWSDLGDRFYERLHGRTPNRRYLQVPALAYEIEAAFGRPELNQMLRDAIPDLQHEPSPSHVKLLNLPWFDVFTTNYDTLLERACRFVISQRYDIIVNPEDLGRSKRPRIIKLHGSLPSNCRPFIVTDEDYRRYPHEFAPFVNTVRQALLENTLCLIGFSGDDPNFLQWIGWIHDNLGHGTSPKMYLIGSLRLSHSQKALLERRNIIPVDMSECTGVGDDHYQALEWFLDYLGCRQSDDNQLDWPSAVNRQTASTADDEPGKLVEIWKAHRFRYPGWVVLPEDLRVSLWRETSASTYNLPTSDTLPGLLDLEFAFELTWRMEKCLLPIFDNQAAFVETTVDRYWPVTNSGASCDSLSIDANDVQARGLTLDDIRHNCHYLLLAMMRYYREEGRLDKWDDACNRIRDLLPTLSPEHEARFHYERALFALFTLNLQELKTRLAEWPCNNTLPFWAAKRAGLLAEIGQVSEAEHILEQSLDAIRAKLNLAPTKADYTLVSQESFVMYLLLAVRQCSLLTASDQSDIQRQRRDFRKRWHVLKQYKCDPWQEFETFKHKLQRAPETTSPVTERLAFDIGRSVQTHRLGGQNNEALAAYNFLRFCEDAGIPFQVSGCKISTKSAAGTLTRIAATSSYWALATLVRISDAKAVDQIFDRASLARMDMPAVDKLIERYLNSLRVAVTDIKTRNPHLDPNFGTLLADVLSEILSRLCCKCSRTSREALLQWLLDVYHSKPRRSHQGIGNLVRRLLMAFTVRERVELIPKLLQFPILTNLNPIEQREYLNPFDFLDLHEELTVNAATIANMELDVFFQEASSDNPAARKWAVSTLGTLHNVGLLDPTQARRFAAALWSQVDSDGLPSGTNYRRFAFLSLPHPEEHDPVECFIRYVRDAKFPAQESQAYTRLGFGGNHENALCQDLCGAQDIQWSKDDLRSIMSRLVEWWDTDKGHLNMNRALNHRPFSSIAVDLRKRVSVLVRTLAWMVVKYGDSVDEESVRSTVKRVAKECSEYKVPALRLEVACAYMTPPLHEYVLHRVEDAMTSPDNDAVIDALEAMDIVSHRTVVESREGELMPLLCAASQMIRWRRETALSETIEVVGAVVKKHPWIFVDDVEGSVLTGLGHLITETAARVKNRARIDRNGGGQDVARKLRVRRSTARLAYRLFEHYRARDVAMPVAIKAWEGICRSDSEFAEIKNEWLAV